MLQSMTGYTNISFSFTTQKNEVVHFEATLKSLNSRFFELHSKMPSSFYPLENKIIKILKKALKRGSIYLNINCLDPDKLMNEVDVCFGTLNSYISAVENIKSKFGINDDIKISDIMRLPNIFSSSEINLTQEQEDKVLQKISELADKLIKERLIEGAELQKDFTQRIDKISLEISEISNEFDKYFQEKQAVINDKINKLVKDTEEAELTRNYLYSVLDKMDINEEIVRFKSHLKKVAETIESQNPEKGKSLDFTLQELGRETNTILSKTPNPVISNLGLNIKVEIEKSREQVQNII